MRFTVLTFVLVLGFTSQSVTASAAPPDFDKDVAPLLATRCLDCHCGADPKGGLDLTRKDAVLGKDGPVVAGKPDASELWKKVAADEMPPKKPLSADEKALLKEWIASGAKWGTDPIDTFATTTAKRAGRDWWSLQPVKTPGRALCADANPIDSFIRTKLADKGCHRPRRADKRTLIRRVYFDLLGLPPTFEEVEAFANDKSPDAYEKLIDRLLASPHYGERWGRYWLDVVALRRDLRLRARPGEAGRLEVPRLGHPGLQRRHAVRPLRPRATRRRRAARPHASDRHRHRLPPPGHLERRAERPARVQVRPARRHGPRDEHGVPRA